MNFKQIILVLLLVLALVVVLVAPKWIQPDATGHSSSVRIATENRIQLTCNLNETDCHYQSAQFGHITVSVSPKAFPAFKPLTFSVNVEKQVEGITVSMEGREMYMGQNLVRLTNSGNHWQGEGMIPVCSVDSNMVWIVLLTLSGKEVEQLVFEVSSAH